ncbi:MAG: PAS domain-containing protein [Proteobacteria bacterium]|nr:PAS domain-containing protein [Pseudomonadota bacterium]
MTQATWRIFRVVTTVVLLVGLLTALLLEQTLRSDLIDRIQADLQARAAVATTVAQGVPLDELDAVADALGEASGDRLTFILADGTVIADSTLDGADLASVENHADRPEVQEALASGYGTARRHSTTIKTDLLYVAMSQELDGKPGVTRAATPLTQVDAAVTRLRITLFTSVLLALGLAILASWLAARLVNRELEALLQEARTLAAEIEDSDGDPDEPDEDEDEDEDEPREPPRPREADRQEAELAQAVRALAEQRDLVRTVLNGMSDGVVGLDSDGRVRLANAAALELLNWSKVPKGKRFGKRAPDALSEYLTHVEDSPTRTELDFDRRQKVEVATASLPQTDGQVLVLRDVTELRRLETVRRDFVGNVSHELRTPVTVILANTETLLHGGALDDPAGRIRFTEAIDRQAHRLHAIIADLLQISRIEAGEVPLTLEPIPIAGTLESVIESTAAVAKRHGVTVMVDRADGSVNSDARALHSIVENLVINAIKYGNGQVTLATETTEGRTRVYVRDNGPGIPAAHRERVFERFYRVDKGRSREVGGTGLGLSIVRNLARAMGGRVGVKTAPEGGAAFWVELATGSPTE